VFSCGHKLNWLFVTGQTLLDVRPNSAMNLTRTIALTAAPSLAHGMGGGGRRVAQRNLRQAPRTSKEGAGRAPAVSQMQNAMEADAPASSVRLRASTRPHYSAKRCADKAT
jgi:hypothetical protein